MSQQPLHNLNSVITPSYLKNRQIEESRLQESEIKIKIRILEEETKKLLIYKEKQEIENKIYLQSFVEIKKKIDEREIQIVDSSQKLENMKEEILPILQVVAPTIAKTFKQTKARKTIDVDMRQYVTKLSQVKRSDFEVYPNQSITHVQNSQPQIQNQISQNFSNQQVQHAGSGFDYSNYSD